MIPQTCINHQFFLKYSKWNIVSFNFYSIKIVVYTLINLHIESSYNSQIK